LLRCASAGWPLSLHCGRYRHSHCSCQGDSRYVVEATHGMLSG
jgi:hypothetical protein